MAEKLFTWIPSDVAQAFTTSGSTATIATKEEFKLSPAFKTRDLEHAAITDGHTTKFLCPICKLVVLDLKYIYHD
jgi:hypothetical protein